MQYKKIAVLPAVILAMSLTACGGSSKNKSSDDDHNHVDSAGRLMVSDADVAEVAVINIKNGKELGSFTLTNKASALYASPQYRFGLAIQRDDNTVQVVDGGLYQEWFAEHNHYHDHEETPELTNITLSGTAPTHYNVHEGVAALFNDGASGAVASVAVFNDEQLHDDEIRTVELDNNMHGAAEPRPDGHLHLLATVNPAEAGGLPTQVKLFEAHDDHFDSVETFATTCPGLHGSFSTEEASLFGCSDGVLVITQDGEDFTATKIDNPAAITGESRDRIGSFSGYAHSEVVGAWVGNVLWAVHLDEAEIEAVDWNGVDDVTKVSAKMDDEGEVLAVLDNTGAVHLLDAKNDFARLHKVDVIETMPSLEGHASVSMVSSPVSEEMFIVDSVAKKIAVVDVETGELKEAIALDFTPNDVAWVGIAGDHDGEEEGHDEDGEDDGHNH